MDIPYKITKLHEDETVSWHIRETDSDAVILMTISSLYSALIFSRTIFSKKIYFENTSVFH